MSPAILPAPANPAVYLRAGGGSTSGTPGTEIARITAPGGTYLEAISLLAKTTTGSGVTLIVQYTDETEVDFTIPSPSGALFIGLGNSGLIMVQGNSNVTSVLIDQAKRVQEIRAETAGTGTFTRYVGLAAQVVPL